jgi:hypothetical protein
MKKNEHGNRLRTPEDAYERIKQRSKDDYAKRNLAINPYWLNEKILRRLFGLFGPNNPIDPQILEDMGFDFTICKFKETIGLNEFEIMGKFGYVLLHQTEKVLICKI